MCVCVLKWGHQFVTSCPSSPVIFTLVRSAFHAECWADSVLYKFAKIWTSQVSSLLPSVLWLKIFDSFFYDTSIHTVQRENKIKKSKKMTKKTIKLKAAVKKKYCSIMVCIQICPGYIVCHSGGYFCIHCLVCLRVTGLHQLHMNILQTVWCSYHSKAKTVQFTVQYITILLCFIVKWLKLPKLKAAYIISFFLATVIGYYFSKLLKSWIVH